MHLQANGNRYFMVPIGDNFKEIGLSAKVVDGLIKINKCKPNEKYDCGFLKGLLIGFCSIPKIQQNEHIDDAALSLIRDLFEWRVGQNEHRLNRFDQLLIAAINGIKNNNFKP